MARKKKTKFKIDKHDLTPKHQKASEKEKKEVMEKFKAKLADLPKIYKSDPAIINIDCKPGDLIRITRPSTTAGETIFYRVVIDV